jgi:hypothetical protein
MKVNAIWAALVAATVSTSALADTVTVNWSSPIIAPTPADTVSWAGTSAAGSDSAPAGRFHGSITSFSGAITAGQFVDSQSSLLAYCYDLLQFVSDGPYTINYAVPGRTLEWLGAVNYVLNGNSNTWVDAYAWLHPADSNIAAAIQIGIWESLYDPSGWSLTAGEITFSGLAGATSTAYASFQTAVENASVNDLPSGLAMLFVSDGNQDVITGRRPDRQLPEPGSLALLGLGAALGAWSRRRRR